MQFHNGKFRFYSLLGKLYSDNRFSTTFIHDMAFDWDDEGHIWCNPYPADTFEGADALPLLDYAGILSYIRDNPDKTQGISLDRKQRLFFNGELYTRSWRVWYEYWSDKIPGWADLPAHDTMIYPADSPYIYLGKDETNLVYWWVDDYGVDIYNSKGIMIRHVDIEGEPATGIAALHPSGDLYFMRDKPAPGFRNVLRDDPYPDGSPILAAMELFRISRNW